MFRARKPAKPRLCHCNVHITFGTLLTLASSHVLIYFVGM